MQIVFKEPRMLVEFVQMSPKLKEIIFWMLEHAWPKGPNHKPYIDFVFTCVGRTKEENAAMGGHKYSPHVRQGPRSFYRACDARNRTLNDAQKAEVVSKVNAHFVYDPDRPFLKVLISNDKWSTGPHFHFQVHPNTRIR